MDTFQKVMLVGIMEEYFSGSRILIIYFYLLFHF
jgi:hypothetical protein